MTNLLCRLLRLRLAFAFSILWASASAQVDTCGGFWTTTLTEWGGKKNVSVPVMIVDGYRVYRSTSHDGSTRLDTVWTCMPTGKWSRVTRKRRERFIAPRNPNCPADTTYHVYELKP